MFYSFNVLCMFSVCCLCGVINDNNNNYYYCLLLFTIGRWIKIVVIQTIPLLTCTALAWRRCHEMAPIDWQLAITRLVISSRSLGLYLAVDRLVCGHSVSTSASSHCSACAPCHPWRHHLRVKSACDTWYMYTVVPESKPITEFSLTRIKKPSIALTNFNNIILLVVIIYSMCDRPNLRRHLYYWAWRAIWLKYV